MSGKLKFYYDLKYNFYELFNTNNGTLIRSNNLILKKTEPNQRSFPELIDIGIMGHCHVADKNICGTAGIECYQSAKRTAQPNMAYCDYSRLIKECNKKTFQIALGGSGDPNKHEDFESILKVTRNSGIIPNFTTSGLEMTSMEMELSKYYCGAIAVSHYSRLIESGDLYYESNDVTNEVIMKLVSMKCIVNVHYILSSETISEAIVRLEKDLFPKGINAVVFIMYKPVGYGMRSKTLSLKSDLFSRFLDIIDSKKMNYKIGFDTCCSPALIKNCKNIISNSIEYCEAARFSMYIDCCLNAYPCSFDCDKKTYKVNIKNATILHAWNSEQFRLFKVNQDKTCPTCSERRRCPGRCALDIDFNICGG